MEILGKLLGSPARIKIMRLFLLNKDTHFSSKDVAKRCRVSQVQAVKELRLLSNVTFIKKNNSGWTFNTQFKYTKEFENLLITADTLDKKAIINAFRKAGRVKLLILSGLFIKDKESRVDLMMVGDALKRPKIEEEIRKLEAEIGAELVYAIFDSKEFVYRLNMYDKLVRDILDFPHEIIWQTKDIPTQALKKR